MPLTAWGAPSIQATRPAGTRCKDPSVSAARHAGPPRLGHPAPAPARPGRLQRGRSPRSVTGWLTGPGGRLLAELAETAHRRQLTHALLDEQPQTALHHVRDMFVQAGVLPARDEYLERIEP